MDAEVLTLEELPAEIAKLEEMIHELKVLELSEHLRKGNQDIFAYLAAIDFWQGYIRQAH